MKTLLAAILLCSLPMLGQAIDNSAFGTVDGSILCTDGNVPARQATVQLVPLTTVVGSNKDQGAMQGKYTTTADFDGRFVITHVPVGTYIVEAKKAGYADDLELVRLVLGKLTLEQQNQILAGFPQVVVQPGSDTARNVVLRRAAALSGHVLADDGGTFSPINVTAVLVSSPLLGDLSQTPDFKRTATTDDRGAYRIAGLPNGKYRVATSLHEAYIDVTVVDKASPRTHLGQEQPNCRSTIPRRSIRQTRS